MRRGRGIGRGIIRQRAATIIKRNRVHVFVNPLGVGTAVPAVVRLAGTTMLQ